MSRFLIDTNHLAPMLRDLHGTRQRMREAIKSGQRFGVCVPILCELETGLHHTKHRDANSRVLTDLLKQVRIWPIERTLVQIYAATFHELRSQGRVRSQVDILIAALCRERKLVLLTADQDFTALPDIRTENWLV